MAGKTRISPYAYRCRICMSKDCDGVGEHRLIRHIESRYKKKSIINYEIGYLSSSEETTT